MVTKTITYLYHFSTILNIKRFTGKIPGHIHKILNLSNKPNKLFEKSKFDTNNSSNDKVTPMVEKPFLSFKEKENNLKAVDNDRNVVWNRFVEMSKNSIAPSTRELLQKTYDNNLTTYENVNTYVAEDHLKEKQFGATRLTKHGRDLYLENKNEMEKTNNVVNNNLNKIPSGISNDLSKIILEAGMVKIDCNTVITTATQEHLVVTQKEVVVLYYTNTNTRIGIGILTSENNETHYKLTSDQPISENPNKAQFLRLFDKPSIISEDDFTIHQKATQYVQQVNVIEHIKEIIKKSPEMQKNPVQYNAVGLTETDLKKLLLLNEIKNKLKADAEILAAEKLKKNPLNSFQENKRLKEQKSTEKRLEYEKKQKEEAMKKKSKEKTVEDIT